MPDGKNAAGLSKLYPLRGMGYTAHEIDAFIDSLNLSSPANYSNLKRTNHLNFGVNYRAGHTAGSSPKKNQKHADDDKIILASFEDLGESFFTLNGDRYFPYRQTIEYEKGGSQSIGIKPAVEWSIDSNLMALGDAAFKSSRAGSPKWGFSLRNSNIAVIDIDSNDFKELFEKYRHITFCGWKIKPDGTLSAHLFFLVDKLVPRFIKPFGLGIDLLGNEKNYSVNFDSEKTYNDLPPAPLTQGIIDEFFGVQGQHEKFIIDPPGSKRIGADEAVGAMRHGLSNAAISAIGGAGKTYAAAMAMAGGEEIRLQLQMKANPF
ncbi:MAG: hypothetical protein FWG30_11730, partial [Eubacteriaceae bacterium]|nr:hypothetical protein [Eubacteriaceae bacterium]